MSSLLNLGIVSLSGGQDSTTVLLYAMSREYQVHALSFVYGQTLKKEVEQAQKICNLLNIPHHIFDISEYSSIAFYSALTKSDRFEIPKFKNASEIAEIIPHTYVPMRNSFFTICCAAYLESLILEQIEIENIDPESITGSIFIAANSIDFSNYPDCRKEFYDSIKETIRIGSKVGNFYNIPIEIQTPLISLSKKEITLLGIQLGVPLHLTWSCYEGKELACGKCPSCLLRIKGFREAGYIDPIEYEIPIDWGDAKQSLKGEVNKKQI